MNVNINIIYIFFILITLGVPKLIKANMIKPGATVIDVGITKVTDENGKSRLVGDVDYDGKWFIIIGFPLLLDFSDELVFVVV